MTKKEEARQEKYLQIITALNKRRQQGRDGFWDCGELGIAYIYWYSGWNVRWFNGLNTEFLAP